jgi:hypothetical protein
MKDYSIDAASARQLSPVTASVPRLNPARASTGTAFHFCNALKAE